MMIAFLFFPDLLPDLGCSWRAALDGDKDQKTGLCMITHLCVTEVFFIFNYTSQNTTCIMKSSQQKGPLLPL